MNSTAARLTEGRIIAIVRGVASEDMLPLVRALEAGGVRAIEVTVSYTHLDVYKRQVQHDASARRGYRQRPALALALKRDAAGGLNCFQHDIAHLCNLQSVSYTHLDVYKRQPLRRAPRSSRPCQPARTGLSLYCHSGTSRAPICRR